MELIFSGADNEDVATFLRRVQLAALDRGSARRDALLFDIAIAGLEGISLRWYCEQDAGATGSWQELRLAMLARFPAPVQPRSSPSHPPIVKEEESVQEIPCLSTVKVCPFLCLSLSPTLSFVLELEGQ